jgi:hypothetical protein
MPVMLSHACSVDELRDLAHRRFTVADRVRQPGTLRAPTVVRIRISDAGRKAFARQEGGTNRVRLGILVLFVLGTLAGMGRSVAGETLTRRRRRGCRDKAWRVPHRPYRTAPSPTIEKGPQKAG